MKISTNMYKDIFVICDYQVRVGSKYFDNPYRYGMNKYLLMNAFNCYGFNLQFALS